MPEQYARGTILAVAMRVFQKRGIDDTRVEDILVAAKLARRTFYKYFSSKEDVLAALYELTTGELVRSIEAAHRTAPTPLAAIHQGIDMYFDLSKTVPGLRGLIERSLQSSSQLAARRRWLRDRLVRILDAAVRAHDGRKLDPLVYYALLSALEGVSLQIDGAPRALDRGRKVIHALLDQTLAKQSKLPTYSGRRPVGST